MDDKQLLRWASIALIPAGVTLAILNLYIGSVVGIIFGTITILFGVGCYSILPSLLDGNYDFSDRRTATAALFQLAGTLLVFALLTRILVDFSVLAESIRTGITLTPLTYVGVGIGLFLGGGVPYFISRREFVARLSRLTAVSVGGMSLTVGTYILLLVGQPVSGVLYAVAYLLSRLGALGVIYAGPTVRTQG